MMSIGSSTLIKAVWFFSLGVPPCRRLYFFWTAENLYQQRTQRKL